ncbi:hypothetical protein BCR44DRAFT_81459 [Catenaria anguillulae PL171]|uniref:WAP domain-containing protein n=1 Tax=Catenaria anguillulae PL171 TaxID=765915 RepID=A0A1Y2HMJ3_9FUNG|nr:hypothetical protein BCR44DRAFT_81459 [Catenaria anguillulae PL171]
MQLSTLFALIFAATAAVAQASPNTDGSNAVNTLSQPASYGPGCYADCAADCGSSASCRSTCARICRDPWGPGGPRKKAKRNVQVVEPKRVDPICYSQCSADCGNNSKCKGDCIRICRDPWGPGGPRKVKRAAEPEAKPQRNCSEQRMCMRRCPRGDDACRDACANIPCF